jgi:GntR family transcriptional regulator
MLIVVNPSSGVPVYRQLMDQVRFHIASGLLKPGDELPSTRALSSQLGVNPMTISKAYSYLERDGVVERRPGRPLVVKALTEKAIQESKRGQLRESLRPTVTMVHQLGIDRDEALDVFRDMLSHDEKTGAGAREEEES